MAQYIKINQCNISHLQTEEGGWTAESYLNLCRKTTWQSSLLKIKILKILGIAGNYLDKIKTVYEDLTVNIILNSKKLKTFPLKLGTKQGCLLSPPPVFIESSSQCNRQDKEEKVMYIRKEEIKSPLLEDDIILYVENPKDYTYTQMLEQITEFTTFQDIKSTQK